MITYVQTIPSTDEYNQLSESVGWGVNNKVLVEKALSNSLYTVCAYDDSRIVGFGRLIGDEVMFLYIQDVMVLPEYQGRKIGTDIMEHLIGKVNELKKTSPGIRTYLGAASGKDGFYKKFGFVTREEAGLGAGMILF